MSRLDMSTVLAPGVTTNGLLEAYIADLEIDLACAERDGQPEYAIEVKRELDALKVAVESGVEIRYRYGVPAPVNTLTGVNDG